MAGIEWRAALPGAAASADAVAREAGARLAGELPARVVLGHKFDISVRHSSVFGLVLDAQIGQLEVTSDDREVVFLGKRQAILHDVGVFVTVLAIQEPLVVAFQLVIEDDPRNATALTFDPGGFLLVNAIQLRVMPQLARLHDVGVVLLPVTTRWNRGVRVQEVLTVPG